MDRKSRIAACLIAGASLAAPAMAEGDRCAAINALIKSGQGDVPFAEMLEKREGVLRKGPVPVTSELIIAPFKGCRIEDEIDQVDRPSTTLSCFREESNVTEESRASFQANEFAQFVALIECMSANEDWNFYKSREWSTEMVFSGHLLTEAETRLEDAIGIELTIKHAAVTELSPYRLSMHLRTVPRDYR